MCSSVLRAEHPLDTPQGENVPLNPRSTPFCTQLDTHVKKSPDATFAVLVPPQSTQTSPSAPRVDQDDALHRVSWRELAYAVNIASHRVNPLTLAHRPSPQGKVIGILAVTDTLVYIAIMLAIVRSGNIVGLRLYSIASID